MVASPRAHAYHRMSIGEKQTAARAQLAEPPVRCPGCDVATPPAELLDHVVERCPGSVEPGPAAKWIPSRDAVALGVPKPTLFRWADRGFVRFQGERQSRKYLLRDLTVRMARRSIDLRR